MGKETAEQKLLKLIEATDSKDGVAPAAAGTAVATAGAAGSPQQVYASVKGIGISTVGVPAVLQNLLAMLQPKGGSAKPALVLGLRDLNKIFVIVIVAVGLFLAFDVLRGWQGAQRNVLFEPDKNLQQAASALPTFKDITEYIQSVTRRNIFQPYEEKTVSTEPGQTPQKEEIAKKMEGLKLVGISWLDTPESATVMIEDEKSTVTYFLKKGEEFKGFKVTNIYADRVILSCQGETITVNL